MSRDKKIKIKEFEQIEKVSTSLTPFLTWLLTELAKKWFFSIYIDSNLDSEKLPQKFKKAKRKTPENCCLLNEQRI